VQHKSDERIALKCSHERLKSFVFSTGQIIECCPDCTHKDLARQAILAGVKKNKSAREILDEKGYTTVPTHKSKPAVDKLLVPDRDVMLDLDEPGSQDESESNLTIGAHAS
jgi:hypothetical protein